MNTKQKFRPYLTSDEMNDIISALKMVPEPRGRLIYYLEAFLEKVTEGATKAAISVSNKPTLAESLGLGDSPASVLSIRSNQSPEQKRASAYKKWQTNPLSCTHQELALAHTYRYENDLMTTAEELEYLSKISS